LKRIEPFSHAFSGGQVIPISKPKKIKVRIKKNKENDKKEFSNGGVASSSDELYKTP